MLVVDVELSWMLKGFKLTSVQKRVKKNAFMLENKVLEKTACKQVEAEKAKIPNIEFLHLTKSP